MISPDLLTLSFKKELAKTFAKKGFLLNETETGLWIKIKDMYSFVEIEEREKNYSNTLICLKESLIWNKQDVDLPLSYPPPELEEMLTRVRKSKNGKPLPFALEGVINKKDLRSNVRKMCQGIGTIIEEECKGKKVKKINGLFVDNKNGALTILSKKEYNALRAWEVAEKGNNKDCNFSDKEFYQIRKELRELEITKENEENILYGISRGNKWKEWIEVKEEEIG